MQPCLTNLIKSLGEKRRKKTFLFKRGEIPKNWVVATHICFFNVHPENWGEDEPNLTSIFFRGVETTNQKTNSLRIQVIMSMKKGIEAS